LEPLKETKEEFASRFAHYSGYQGQFDRAIDAVLNGCVKVHIFSPSGRVIYTVVGRSGEEFIDPFKPFCSCKNFFFGVLGGRNQTCYHLLSYQLAKESGMFDKIDLHDEEFESFTRFLVGDLAEKESAGSSSH
jgi:predicted nucleic acid-binding Zn finger protein